MLWFSKLIIDISVKYMHDFVCGCFSSAWLEGEEDPVIDRVNQRIEDITGLTVETAELLQVL